MAKLTYWIAPILDDSSCYNIRCKTRKEARALREQYGEDRFGEPEKHIVYYKDALDLACYALGECKLDEPSC